MTRLLAILSSAALLTAAAHAQCPEGAAAGLVNWDATAGYASTWGFADEGLTSPPIALTAFANFPMAGAVGNLDQLWVNANGEVYLTDSTLALTVPAGGALYGCNTALEMRGNVAGGSARVVALGGDHEDCLLPGASWSVTVNQATPGEIHITWVDMRRLGNTTDRFSFKCTLFATGVVSFQYGTSFPLTGFTGRYVGVSIGNLVGTTTPTNFDLSASPDSGTLGLLYQNFSGTAPNNWDLSGSTVVFTPNGTGGYTVLPLGPYVPPACASNISYGAGCYGDQVNSSIAQLWANQSSAKPALDGNSMTYTNNGSSYVMSWNVGGGASYVAPSLGATVLAHTDDNVLQITPSAAIPTPFGSVATWSVAANGILTAAATGNNGTDFSPTLADVANNTTAPNLGFYCWNDYNPGDVASGKVKWEEVGGILYVTWDAVESYGTPALTPSTFQWQVDMTSGNINLVWNTMWAGTTSTSNPVIVGATLPGAGTTPPSTNLATTLPRTLGPTDYTSIPLALSASPPPVINPSTLVTYTVSNIPEIVPGSGVYISTMFLSVGSLPGVDLGIIGAPGCLAHILSLDVNLSVGVPVFPTQTATFTFDNIAFAPGNTVYAQAIALFDVAANPGLAWTNNTFGLMVSNAIAQTTQMQ